MIRTVRGKGTAIMKYLAMIYAVLLVGIDQLIKQLVCLYLKPVSTIPLIQDAVHLTYMENRGAAFSSMQGRYLFLVIFTSIVIIAGIIWICASKKDTPKLALWSIATIIGGGIGNLLDRVFRGFVVDYIDFRIINFAVFNFADICITCGTILFAAYIIFSDFGRKNAGRGKK